jgi:hypothetical protein
MKARKRKIPPLHQVAFVKRLPVCREPKSELAELLTPPKVAARPWPWPLCRSTATIKTMLSMVRSTIRNVYNIYA